MHTERSCVLCTADTDDNGAISRREFAGAMTALGLTADDEEMSDLFDALDPDGSGMIEYSELKTLLSKPKKAGTR